MERQVKLLQEITVHRTDATPWKLLKEQVSKRSIGFEVHRTDATELLWWYTFDPKVATGLKCIEQMQRLYILPAARVHQGCDGHTVHRADATRQMPRNAYKGFVEKDIQCIEQVQQYAISGTLANRPSE